MDKVGLGSFEARCGALAAKYGNRVYDVVLYDNGKITRYAHRKANLCNNSYSVSKMFCMTAVGMLIDSGKLSLEDKITAVLSNEIVGSYDPKWDQVTVEHALAHKMGTARMYLDIDCDDVAAYGTKDYLALALREPLTYEPGTHYAYSDAAYYLLSRVVTKVSGERLDDFLLSRLFTPMNFQEMAWSKCPGGFTMGATGLYCRTADMVKLGILFLNRGVYDGKRYLSEAWIRTAEVRCLGIDPCAIRSICKGGAFGQVVAYCPETGKALAAHSYDDAGTDFIDAAIREFLEK